MSSAPDAATLDASTARPGHAHGWVLPVLVPMLFVVVVLTADAIEGPKTAYVGVLTAVPMLAAVFGTARQTAMVAVLTWLSAYGFGLVASDGNAPAQTVRLVIIALVSVLAVLAAHQRCKQEDALVEAERERSLVDRVRREASTDLLTGLQNRRGLSAALEDEERDEVWTIAAFDCDGLKAINDSLGHAIGDEYLQTAALRLSRALGTQDHLGRWGGDEFLAVLPLAPERALPVLRRVHHQVSRDPVQTSSGQVDLRATIGAAPWRPDQQFEHALRDADHALYQGKRSGGNVVVVLGAGDDPAAPGAAS